MDWYRFPIIKSTPQYCALLSERALSNKPSSTSTNKRAVGGCSRGGDIYTISILHHQTLKKRRKLKLIKLYGRMEPISFLNLLIFLHNFFEHVLLALGPFVPVTGKEMPVDKKLGLDSTTYTSHGGDWWIYCSGKISWRSSQKFKMKIKEGLKLNFNFLISFPFVDVIVYGPRVACNL